MIDHSYSKYSSLYGSGGSRGGALFLDQTEARRAEKNIFRDRPPLAQGLDDQAPPPPLI